MSTITTTITGRDITAERASSMKEAAKVLGLDIDFQAAGQWEALDGETAFMGSGYPVILSGLDFHFDDGVESLWLSPGDDSRLIITLAGGRA